MTDPKRGCNSQIKLMRERMLLQESVNPAHQAIDHPTFDPSKKEPMHREIVSVAPRADAKPAADAQPASTPLDCGSGMCREATAAAGDAEDAQPDKPKRRAPKRWPQQPTPTVVGKIPQPDWPPKPSVAPPYNFGLDDESNDN